MEFEHLLWHVVVNRGIELPIILFGCVKHSREMRYNILHYAQTKLLRAKWNFPLVEFGVEIFEI